MALQIEIIPFTLRVGTGTQTISHVRYPSLQGKSVIFVGESGTSSVRYDFGIDDGVTHLGSAVAVNEAFGVSVSARAYSTQYSLLNVHAQASFGGASTHLKGYVSAFNVGSFTITLDLNNIGGGSMWAIIIGGDDVECAVGLYDVSPGSGTVNVGFDPVALVKLSVPDAATTGLVAGAYHGYGFATDCTSDKQVGWGVACNSITSAATSYQIDGVVQQDITSAATTIDDAVSVAFVTNGFDVTVDPTPDWNIGYLAIGGSAVSANLVAITQPTSTGLQNVTIDATDPVAVFFGSTCKVATAGAGRADANLMFGAYDGLSQMSQWWGTVNGAAFPYMRNSLVSSTKAITLATATGAGTSTTNAAASCTLASTNIALTWSSADATQRQVWALVLAQNLTGSANACGVNPQASITVLKQTTPIPGGETEFPFGATGGLSPASFTLMDGESQLFSSVAAGTYGITEAAPAGWTASYDVSNDDPHDAIVISGTEAVTVTVTNTFQSSAPIFRRYRRFALPYDENVNIYLSRLEVIAQMGVGNADATNPVLQIRISKDGGSTFGAYRTLTLGAAAAYTTRAYSNRWGRGRNLVCELICDDPVFVAFIACFAQAEKGVS